MAFFRKGVTSRHYGLVFFLFLLDMLPHVLCEQVSFTSQLGLLGRGKWACLFVYLDVYHRSHVGVVLFPSGHAHSSRREFCIFLNRFWINVQCVHACHVITTELYCPFYDFD